MAFSMERQSCIIQAGYLAVAEEPAHLSSVCGSGLVVTLWDRILKHGGIAHCLLTKKNRPHSPSNYEAETAIPLLVQNLKQMNPRKAFLEAQIFGGGLHPVLTRRHPKRVLNTIHKILRKFDIPVVSEDTGGSLGRKIIFDTCRGEVMVYRTHKIRRTDWCPECLMTQGNGGER